MAEARIVRSAEGKTFGPNVPPWIFKHGALNDSRFDFLICEIAYLVGPPLHVHDEQDDTFFVLDGVLTVQVEDELFDLEPGDFATVPPGVPHTFANVRDENTPVRVCNMMTPAGLDQQFHDITMMGDEALNPAKMAQMREKHGVSFVGPTLAVKLGLA